MERHIPEKTYKYIKYFLVLSLAFFIILIMSDITLKCFAGSLLFFIVISFFILKKWDIPHMLHQIKSVHLLISLLISGGFTMNFFTTGGDFMEIAPAIILMGLLTLPFVTFSISYIFESGICYFKSSDNTSIKDDTGYFNYKISFIIISLVYIVGISALVRANTYYLDDIDRTAKGFQEFYYSSRYLAEGLSNFIFANSYLTDISPITHILAVLIMAAAGILVLRIITGRTVFRLCEIISLVPLCLNPYFLECISFKFDSPFMALSVFFAILPALYRYASPMTYIATTAVGTAMSLSTYQTSANIFIILTLFLALHDWIHKDENMSSIFKYILRSAVGYLTGCLFYYTVIMVSRDVYIINELPSSDSIFRIVLNNLQIYVSILINDLSPLWLSVIIATIAAYVVSSIVTSKRSMLITFSVMLVAVFLFVILSFIFFSILEEPSYRARAMYCFFIMISFLCVSITVNTHKLLLRIPVFILCWMFFVFSFTYGNALYLQTDYIKYRSSLLFNDLNGLEILRDCPSAEIHIMNTPGFSPAVSSTLEHYPVLERLVMPGNYWLYVIYGDYYDNTHDYIDDRSIKFDASAGTYFKSMDIDVTCISDSMFHSIYKSVENDDVTLYIIFK